MAKGSKLLAALDREKGVNHKLERQKKQQKAAEKRKRSRVEDQEDEAVLEDAIKEAEETVSGDAGKKDKKGAKRAKVEQEDEVEEEDEEWETDDEDKTHAVCVCAIVCTMRMMMLILCSRKTLQDWSRTIPRTSLIQRTTSMEAPSWTMMKTKTTRRKTKTLHSQIWNLWLQRTRAILSHTNASPSTTPPLSYAP